MGCLCVSIMKQESFYSNVCGMFPYHSEQSSQPRGVNGCSRLFAKMATNNPPLSSFRISGRPAAAIWDTCACTQIFVRKKEHVHKSEFLAVAEGVGKMTYTSCIYYILHIQTCTILKFVPYRLEKIFTSKRKAF